MVPRLFDEYVLAAVQNAGDYEVIGQDDIAALVGFEKQKDMLGCDDASCIANIGGALGVDRVIAIKIARLEPDWVVTSKLINIKVTRVEARTSDMVVGNVKALLNAVPDIVSKLFATAQGRPPPAATLSPSQSGSSRAQPTATNRPAGGSAASSTGSAGLTAPRDGAASVPGPSHGNVARVAGHILTWSGVGCAAFSLLMGMSLDSVTNATGTSYDYTTGTYTTESTKDASGARAGAVVGGLCLILTGVGSGVYLNGKARAITGDDDASGHVGFRWLGWLLAVGGAVGPFLVDSPDAALGVGALGLGSSALVFAISMAASSGYATSQGAERPFASVTILRDHDHSVPGLAMAIPF
jgi:hypothetical protein